VETSAIIVMCFILSVIWGGFFILVNVAYKKEKQRKNREIAG